MSDRRRNCGSVSFLRCFALNALFFFFIPIDFFTFKWYNHLGIGEDTHCKKHNSEIPNHLQRG